MKGILVWYMPTMPDGGLIGIKVIVSCQMSNHTEKCMHIALASLLHAFYNLATLILRTLCDQPHAANNVNGNLHTRY